ncbi:MAG: ABC transporter permease [Caldilineaceae bacterium]|nr:ABC transporter permease [Caldilineaceae bacterium]MCB0098964.1 ABC transporter permease [Caldilineaceae bacterium]
MGRYILRRLIQAIPTLLGVSIISFLLVNSAPGDPLVLRTFGDPNITDVDREIMRRQLGMDQPLPMQYISWMTGLAVRSGNVLEEFERTGSACTFVGLLNTTICDKGGGILRGDLGTSIQTKQAVWDRLVERMPATLELGTAALVLSLIIGVPLGVLSAVYRGSWFDNMVRFLAVIGQAVPNFWLALMAIFLFGVVWGILPTGGRQTATLTGDTDIADKLWHLILPAIVLSFGSLALFSRIMRTETLEVIFTDYIRTAKAKGLPMSRVWFVHALRNSLIPMMTILGPAALGVLAGAVVTETVFTWPGMGRLALDAARQRDYPMVLGAGMFFSVLVIMGNLLSDIFYGIVDPRVRLS